MNRSIAQKLAEEELGIRKTDRKASIPRSTHELCILEEHTIEFEYGWVFFYQSKKYIETRLFQEFRFPFKPNVDYDTVLELKRELESMEIVITMKNEITSDPNKDIIQDLS